MAVVAGKITAGWRPCDICRPPRGLLANQDIPIHSLRRAKAIAHVLDHYLVVIDDDGGPEAV